MWQSLVKIALLGTENSQVEKALAENLAAHGIDTAQEAPLVIANGSAMVGQLKKAGFPIKGFDGTLPSPTKGSSSSASTAKTAHHLHLITSGPHKPVLPEFLEKLSLAGKDIPPSALPNLMRLPDLGQYWQQIEPLLGEQGRWLLALHPSWSERLADPLLFDWQTGNRLERLALTRYWRRTSPAYGLDLIRTTWETESLADKTAFLSTMEMGLSLADEPFLEECLDEKRQEIRLMAAQLLAKIPSSRLVGRLGNLVDLLLEMKGKSLNIKVLTDWPLSATRDGIAKFKGDHGEMASVGYLAHLMAKLHPSFWEGYSGRTPSEFLEILHSSEWCAQLVLGLAKSLDQHQAPNWATALVAFWYDHENLPAWQEYKTTEIFWQVPEAELNLLSLRFLKDAHALPTEESVPFRLLKNNPSAWSDELSMLVVSKFRMEIVRDYRQIWQLQHLKHYLDLLGIRCSPKLYDQLHTGWSSNSVQWRLWEKSVEDMLNRVLFRRELATELAV